MLFMCTIWVSMADFLLIKGIQCYHRILLGSNASGIELWWSRDAPITRKDCESASNWEACKTLDWCRHTRFQYLSLVEKGQNEGSVSISILTYHAHELVNQKFWYRCCTWLGGDHSKAQMGFTKKWRWYAFMRWLSKLGQIGWNFTSTEARPNCFSLACLPPTKGMLLINIYVHTIVYGFEFRTLQNSWLLNMPCMYIAGQKNGEEKRIKTVTVK